MSIDLWVRTARDDAGLSVRGLAEAAGVSASTVHRIEKGGMQPTIEMLKQILEATGSRINVQAEPDYALNLVGLARSFRSDLAQDDTSFLVRKAAEFSHRFQNASHKLQKQMIQSRPPTTGSKEWDAFIGAMAEWLALRAKITTPDWTHDMDRYLDHGWWVTSMKSLKAWEYAGSPASFHNRGVYIHRESLTNV